MNPSRTGRFTALLAVLTLVFSTMVVDYAEARRGGSFGSRGGRTYQSAPATNTAPAAAPVQRSMTSPGQASTAAAAARPAGQRSGMFGSGFGGAMMRGLLIGGLFGLLMGSGFGGLAGMLGLLVQVALIGLLVMLALRFFRSRSSQTASANGASPLNQQRTAYQGQDPNAGRNASGSGLGSRSAAAPKAGVGRDEIGVTQQDLSMFESRLKALQDAYSREDYKALEAIATPEVVSYLAQELAQNAARGVRNEARDVELLQGDVSESWREGPRDYVTVAMRYGMIDVVRDRQSGRIVEGDERTRVESTEVWTFVRERGGAWMLSAIQEA